MNTDQPPHKLSARSSVFAQDLIAPEGIAKQRHGWAYDGTTVDVAANLVGVWRNKFILADTTRTITTRAGNAYVHNSSSSGTSILSTGAAQFLPRCVYRDQLILCAQDGETPMRLYSGTAFAENLNGLDSPSTTADQSIFTASANWNASVTSGSYITIGSDQGVDTTPFYYPRALERVSNTVLTLEDVKTSLAGPTWAVHDAYGCGYTYPCVNVYNAGTGTLDNVNARINAVGSVWSGGSITPTANDGVLILPSTATAAMYSIGTVDSATRITMSGSVSRTDANTNYAIMRRCPFKDAAAHKGSLWGTGVAQYPNNVYVGPSGWNPAFPPGATLPFDTSAFYTSENSNDFLMDSIAVPTAYEGDVNVAILSSPNPLLVLKRSAVHGIYGTFPNFTQDKIVDGAGCIDLRSAMSGPWGQFWAGEDDVYTFRNSQVIPLMDGKISREWQALMRDFDFGVNDYCAIGETNGHLFVSLVTGSGASNRCYVYDIKANAWMSRFTNHKARYFFSSKVDGEANELYWVGDSLQGRVLKSTGAVDGTNPAKDGDGTSPRLQAWTPQGIDGTITIDNDARLLDLSVAHNVYDSGAAGSTSMAVSVVTGGSLEANADATKTLTDIDSDAVDRVDRTRFREVNAKGRLAQVRFDVDTLGTNAASTKVEIHELTGTFRERRSRT